jgi:hypothetical protein
VELSALQKFEAARQQAAQRGNQRPKADGAPSGFGEGALGQFLMKFAGAEKAQAPATPPVGSQRGQVSSSSVDSIRRLENVAMAKQASAGNMQSLQALIDAKRTEQGLPQKTFQTYGRGGVVAATPVLQEQPRGRVVGGRLDLVG